MRGSRSNSKPILNHNSYWWSMSGRSSQNYTAQPAGHSTHDPSRHQLPPRSQNENTSSSGGRRPPRPEEEARASPAEEKVVIPVGKSQNIEEWPTREKPFVFLGYVIDAIDLADNILELGISAYGSGSPTTAPVVTFVNQLTAYGGALRDINDGVELCKTGEMSRSWPNSRDTIRSYARGADNLNACLQDLVAVCGAKIPEVYRHPRGVLTCRLGACKDFIGTLLDQERETMDDLTAAMHDWVQEFVSGCAPLVTSMRQENHRIERMREEAQMRREDERKRGEAWWREEARRREAEPRMEDQRRRDGARWREDERRREERRYRRHRH